MVQHPIVRHATRGDAAARRPSPAPTPRRVGLVSAELSEAGVARLASSASASLSAGARSLVIALEPRGPLSPAAIAVLPGVHLLAATHRAGVTLVTSDLQLRPALSGLPVPGGAHIAASAPVALRAAAGEHAPRIRGAL